MVEPGLEVGRRCLDDNRWREPLCAHPRNRVDYGFTSVKDEVLREFAGQPDAPRPSRERPSDADGAGGSGGLPAGLRFAY